MPEFLRRLFGGKLPQASADIGPLSGALWREGLLGDLVDGGEENDRVVRYVRHQAIPTVRGNHDENNALNLPSDVRAYLDALPEELREGDVLYTHISPRPKKAKISDQLMLRRRSTY